MSSSALETGILFSIVLSGQCECIYLLQWCTSCSCLEQSNKL